MDNIKHIIVVGASAGGFTAVTDLLSKLPDNLPMAMFVVMHLGKSSSPAIIRQHFEKFTNYTCRIPEDNEKIELGNIYIGPPDVHLFVKKDRIRLIHGAHENRYRPSIDVLFRSAAAAFDSHVIGIILSGMLDDGTSGMSAISRCGGICIVQEPGDAAYTDMPESVLSNVEVEHRVPVADMGYILDDIFSKPLRNELPIPDDVKLEAEITERMVSDISELAKLGTHSNYTCPECGGGLWLMKDEKNPRYRCHTGHVYTEQLLADRQGEELEESLWVSIRMLEERRNLLLTMANRWDESGKQNTDQLMRANELAIHIERLKVLMKNIGRIDIPVAESLNR
jgi:two-component system chemotaxis response regulator CheB